MLNGLDLFSGIGGLSIALSDWVRPIAYCERDRYAQSVLLSRMSDGQLPIAPIWDDVQTLGVGTFPNGFPVDIISGGFPCQDISVAGTGVGLAGSRSGLFFQIVRLARELRPRFIFLENVPAITVRGLDRVLLEFTALGFDCRWTIVSAAEMGACHLRERWFFLGHANSEYGELSKSEYPDPDSKFVRIKQEFIKRRNKAPQSTRISDARLTSWSSERFSEPRVGGTGNGIPYRMDRLRGLGNAVVPVQARAAFERLMGLK